MSLAFGGGECVGGGGGGVTHEQTPPPNERRSEEAATVGELELIWRCDDGTPTLTEAAGAPLPVPNSYLPGDNSKLVSCGIPTSQCNDP